MDGQFHQNNKLLYNKNNHSKGILGEKIAALYLMNRGHQIIAKRFRTVYGEIDIISQTKINSQPWLIFSEIKYRKNTRNLMNVGEIVKSVQIKRHIKTALHFLSQEPNQKYANIFCRCDLIIICDDKVIKHVKNAWDLEYVEHHYA